MKITITEYNVDGYSDNSGESRFEAVAKTPYDKWMTSEIRGRGETREAALADFYSARNAAVEYRDRFNKWRFVRDNPVSVELIEEVE